MRGFNAVIMSLSEKCRTCFREIVPPDISIRLDATDFVCAATVGSKLKQCIPELELNTAMEERICLYCSDLLSTAYNFRKICLQTELKFKTLSTIANDVKDEVPEDDVNPEYVKTELMEAETEEVEAMQDFTGDNDVSSCSDVTPSETTIIQGFEKIEGVGKEIIKGGISVGFEITQDKETHNMLSVSITANAEKSIKRNHTLQEVGEKIQFRKSSLIFLNEDRNLRCKDGNLRTHQHDPVNSVEEVMPRNEGSKDVNHQTHQGDSVNSVQVTNEDASLVSKDLSRDDSVNSGKEFALENEDSRLKSQDVSHRICQINSVIPVEEVVLGNEDRSLRSRDANHRTGHDSNKPVAVVLRNEDKNLRSEGFNNCTRRSDPVNFAEEIESSNVGDTDSKLSSMAYKTTSDLTDENLNCMVVVNKLSERVSKILLLERSALICRFCQRVLVTSSGLMRHIDKMHVTKKKLPRPSKQKRFLRRKTRRNTISSDIPGVQNHKSQLLRNHVFSRKLRTSTHSDESGKLRDSNVTSDDGKSLNILKRILESRKETDAKELTDDAASSLCNLKKESQACKESAVASSSRNLEVKPRSHKRSAASSLNNLNLKSRSLKRNFVPNRAWSSTSNKTKIHSRERKAKSNESEINWNESKINSNLSKIVQTNTDAEMKCQFCCITFRSSNIYALHMKLHPGTGTGVDDDIVRHVKSSTLEECPLCKKAFATKGELTSHLSSHSSRTKNCTECKAEFRNVPTYVKHMRDVHGRNEAWSKAQLKGFFHSQLQCSMKLPQQVQKSKGDEKYKEILEDTGKKSKQSNMKSGTPGGRSEMFRRSEIFGRESEKPSTPKRKSQMFGPELDKRNVKRSRKPEATLTSGALATESNRVAVIPSIEEYTSELGIECDLCLKTFENMFFYNCHMCVRNKEAEVIYKCRDCQKYCVGHESFVTHVNNHCQPSAVFTC